MQNLAAATAPQILVLSPEDVTVDPGLNGRFEGAPPQREFVRNIALEILQASSLGPDGQLISGQLAPVGIREDRGLKFGHRRLLAIQLINLGGEDGEDPAAIASQEAIVKELARLNVTPEMLDSGEFTFPLLATVVPPSDDPLSDLDLNVAENGARDPMTDMDWSTVCARYKAKGLSASQIAERLANHRPTKNEKPSASWVMHMLEVRECAPEIQMKVHQGELGVWSALQILRNAKNAASPEATPQETLEAQRNTLSQMIGEDGKVDKKRAREINRVESQERGAKTTKTIAELRQICGKQAAAGSRRAKLILAWIEGSVSDARLVALLADGAEAPEDKKGGKAKKEDAKADAKKGGKAKKDEKPAVDAKTGARLPPKKDAAKNGRGSKPAKPPKAAPAADVVDPDEDPQLGSAPQGAAEMSAEEADAALHSSEGEPTGE